MPCPEHGSCVTRRNAPVYPPAVTTGRGHVQLRPAHPGSHAHRASLIFGGTRCTTAFGAIVSLVCRDAHGVHRMVGADVGERDGAPVGCVGAGEGKDPVGNFVGTAVGRLV